MNHSINRIAAVLLATIWMGCSPNNLGENGVISFSDETRGPGVNRRTGVTNPVAQGAVLNIRVSVPNLADSSVRVEGTSSMTVQSIEGLQDEDESRITLTTQTSGESKLEVTLDDGTVDFIRMSVTKAAHSEIEPFPWDSLIPLDATLWASGMSILPNTNLTLFGHMKSISGQRLTGHHALPWHVETTGDATLSVDDMSDFSVFTSGTTPATNEISFGETRLPIPTISAEDVSEIRLISPFQNPIVQAGSPLVLHAAFFTADGNYVVGIDDEDVLFNVSENAELGRILMDTDPTTAEELNLERAYRFGRATDFRADAPGTYAVTASWKGIEAELIIEVLEQESQPAP